MGSHERVIELEEDPTRKGYSMLRWTRWGLVIVVKLPLIWASETTLSLEFDRFGNASRTSLIVTILIGWYGVLPQLFEMCMAFWYWTSLRPYGKLFNEATVLEKGLIIAFSMLSLSIILFLWILFVHFVGIFGCEQHDFSSVTGCTTSDFTNISN